MNIPLAKPFLGNEEREATERVLDSRRLTTGEIVKEFEDALADKFQRKYCVVVSSGTVALYLALKVLEIKRVIIPALICDAVLYAALNADISVTFTDVDKESHNIDLSSLSEKQLSEADAVIATHTYGHAANMDKLNYYIQKYKLVLIEDFAQATGGYFVNSLLGSFGKIAITSFNATKNMTTGHGGSLFMDDEKLYHQCIHNRKAMNYQITNIQAAIGLVQLNKLGVMTNMRHAIADRYTQELANTSVDLVYKQPWTTHTYYKYAVLLPDNVPKQDFISRMKNVGIEVGKLYDPPLHKLYGNNNKVRLLNAEYLASRTVSLPMIPELSVGDIKKVCETVKSVISDLKVKL